MARTSALVDVEIPVMAPDKMPPALAVLVEFHPPGPLVYGNPVPTEADVRTPWLLEDEVDSKVSVKVSCWVTKIVL